MIDVTSHKVSIPSLLFLIIAPGGRLAKTTRRDAIFHALVFMLAYAIIARALRLVLTKTDYVVTAALFLALNPGTLFAIGGKPGVTAVVAHAVVYAVIFASLRRQFPQYY